MTSAAASPAQRALMLVVVPSCWAPRCGSRPTPRRPTWRAPGNCGSADIGRLTNAVQLGFILGTLGAAISGLADRLCRQPHLRRQRTVRRVGQRRLRAVRRQP
jgi:hypothetical protein